MKSTLLCKFAQNQLFMYICTANMLYVLFYYTGGMDIVLFIPLFFLFSYTPLSCLSLPGFPLFMMQS